ncbi:MAG: DUF3047 domain-containing protein [Candidatus Omnitrophica bacterium]|nr:DUF3047 domain-containing protein [Candidatus Omnitrophota bacterium]
MRAIRWPIGILLVCAASAGCGGSRSVGFPLVGPLISPLVSPLRPSPELQTLFIEPFEELDPKRWREIKLHGQTRYVIDGEGEARALKAHSQAAASVLVTPVQFDPDAYEWLSWRWRVEALIPGEDLARKEGSDAVARVYVYFDTPGLPWQKRSIDYVWSSTLPVETVLESPYGGQSKIVVAESGPARLGMWQRVIRNIEDDYERCYGGKPPRVVAIGIMTDADNTRSEAVAFYDDLMVTKEPPRGQTPQD